MTLKEKILEKGFKDVDVEYPEKEGEKYFIRVWFDFKWNNTGKIALGKQYIDGNTEEEILTNVDKFINEFGGKNNDWTLILKK